ncbi:unnamed protein product [Acanthoscelides obtectus]|nr:unnamed protein product [Acanthoscelides obtectus]CAK1634412.1 hypothetical protein AOBTE_LOCUS8749 [Acanthoscelides obtectus]
MGDCIATKLYFWAANKFKVTLCGYMARALKAAAPSLSYEKGPKTRLQDDFAVTLRLLLPLAWLCIGCRYLLTGYDAT